MSERARMTLMNCHYPGIIKYEWGASLCEDWLVHTPGATRWYGGALVVALRDTLLRLSREASEHGPHAAPRGAARVVCDACGRAWGAELLQRLCAAIGVEAAPLGDLVSPCPSCRPGPGVVRPEDTLREAGIDDRRQAEYQRKMSQLLARRDRSS